jgi:hypothetical protein
MLKNRMLPIVALMAGAMMFGACAEDIAGPSEGGITVVPAVEEDANGARNIDVTLGEGAEVHSPDGEWTEYHPHGKEAQ